MGSVDYDPANFFSVNFAIRPPGYPPISVLVAIGALAGVFSGLFGVGGGVLLVPLLMWWAKMDFLKASATSLGAILPIATISAIPYLAYGEFSLWITLAVVGGSGLGAQLGIWIRLRAKLVALELSFVVFLLGAAALVVSLEPSRDTTIQPSLWSVVLLVGIGVIAGLAAAVFGAGGGVFLVPLLFVAEVGDLVAKSVSLIALIPASIIPSINYLRLGTSRPADLIVVAGAGIVSAPFSAVWAQGLSPAVSAISIAALAASFAVAVMLRTIVHFRAR